MWEGAGDRTETAIFWPPLLWPSTLCLSRSPDAQPEALGSTLLGAGFLYCILSASSPDLNSSGPQAPSAWCGFTYHLSSLSDSNSNWNSNSVLTELYNSPTPTRLPTRSLEWHDWSSSSGNNCHAVHRSLSFGASVYKCIMGFTLSHFISQIHPRDLFRLLAIGMCHFLPVHHFVMASLLGPKVKIQHLWLKEGNKVTVVWRYGLEWLAKQLLNHSKSMNKLNWSVLLIGIFLRKFSLYDTSHNLEISKWSVYLGKKILLLLYLRWPVNSLWIKDLQEGW